MPLPKPATITFIPPAYTRELEQFCENLADVKLWAYRDYQSLLLEVYGSDECDTEELPTLEIPLSNLENFCKVLSLIAEKVRNPLPSQD